MENLRNLRKANLKDSEIQKEVVYNDGELALINNIHDISAILPCQLEVFVIVLVLEGKASVNINGNRYEARPNDLYIGTPNNIVENGLTSLDFKSYSICVSTDYVRRILPLAENSWDVKLLFEKNPLCSLQPEEVRTFCQYYDLLCTKTQQPSPTQKKVIDALMLAFVYDMQGALNRVAQHTPRPFTASETLFKRFIELLGSSYPKPRSVAYYADPRLLFTVQPGSFYPAPKVTSAVIRLDVRATPPVQVPNGDEAGFFRLIRAAFSQRRKTIANVVASGLNLPKPQVLEALQAAGLDARLRPEQTDDFLQGIDREAARIKGYESPVAGDADVFLAPNITAGNLLGKALYGFAGGKMAGVVMGAAVPITVNSRAAKPEEKYDSILIAAAMAAGRRGGSHG